MDQYCVCVCLYLLRIYNPQCLYVYIHCKLVTQYLAVWVYLFLIMWEKCVHHAGMFSIGYLLTLRLGLTWFNPWTLKRERGGERAIHYRRIIERVWNLTHRVNKSWAVKRQKVHQVDSFGFQHVLIIMLIYKERMYIYHYQVTSGTFESWMQCIGV